MANAPFRVLTSTPEHVDLCRHLADIYEKAARKEIVAALTITFDQSLDATHSYQGESINLGYLIGQLQLLALDLTSRPTIE